VNKPIDELFRIALTQRQNEFSVHFTASQIEKLVLYYQVTLKWNPFLHLTTLTSPLDFALRNVMESAFAAPFLLPSVRQLLDIGSGGGLPGIPLAILCPDLPITLIEVNRRKAVFLKEAASIVGVTNISVNNQRFEQLPPVSSGGCVASRALEQLTGKLPELLRFGQHGEQYLFWGTAELYVLAKELASSSWQSFRYLIPASDKRLLISVTRST
jgi:16S rRNA (guanine527-N7)-methyltransferase